VFQIDTELLNTLFDHLNQKIKYLVLRNHQDLPESNNAKDIDILIPSHIRPTQINRIVKDISEELNAKIIWINELDYLSGFVLARQSKCGQVSYVKLDFFYGLKWRGLEFINADEVLLNRIQVRNYYIPTVGHEALIHVLNGILYGKTLNKKYKEIIQRGIVEYHAQFIGLLVSSGLKDLRDLISDLVADNTNEKKYANILVFRKILIKFLIKNQLSVNFLVSFFKSVRTELITRRKLGYLLSFSGPDGAGKSSIMEPVIEFFQLTGICKQKIAHHFLPEAIPPLHRLLKCNKKLSKQNYTQPYSEKPVGKLSSLVRFLYYILAFKFAKYKYLKPQFKRNEVVIFDRYYPDLIADPTRARLSLNRSLLASIFPKVAALPDVALIFIADPNILIARKGELSEEKAKQLVKNYRSICVDRRYTLLENNGSLVEGLTLSFSTLFNALDVINSKRLT